MLLGQEAWVSETTFVHKDCATKDIASVLFGPLVVDAL